ncbi:MAG: hypothetical protein AAFN59_10975 [Pseudomonadota bacterium]
MSWSRIAELWDDLVDQLVGRWPAMDMDVVRAASGAQDRLAAHLAQSHHLTMSEALEELELWRESLARRG